MNSRKFRFFIGEKGVSTIRYAVFHNEDGRHRRKLPGS